MDVRICKDCKQQICYRNELWFRKPRLECCQFSIANDINVLAIELNDLISLKLEQLLKINGKRCGKSIDIDNTEIQNILKMIEANKDCPFCFQHFIFNNK